MYVYLLLCCPMEYDPVKDRLFALTRHRVLLREALFFALARLFLREQHIKRRLRQLGLPAEAFILDAGCGLGQYSFWLAKRFPRAAIFAGDVKKHFISAGNEHAKARGLRNLRFGELDLPALDADAQYDLILAVDVMEHIEDDGDVMRRFCRALRAGGRLVVHTPAAPEDSRTSRADPKRQVEEHVRAGYYPPELVEKLRAAGFAEFALYPTYHPVTGMLLWQLWQNVPLQLTRLGWLGYALIPLWFVLAYPLGYPFWWRDLHLPLRAGRGIIAVATKLQ